MAFSNYELSFAPVLPAMLDRSAITDLIPNHRPVKPGQVTAATLAEIKLAIKNGDEAYREERYEAALSAFRSARARIYKILYPKFDLREYLAAGNVLLPLNAEIEAAFAAVAGQIIDVIRPHAIDPEVVFRTEIRDGMPEKLTRFTTTGFRETLDHEADIQLSAQQGVALLEEGRPQAAIEVMEPILSRVAATGENVDPALIAALELNVAAARLQIGDLNSAGKLADASFEHFGAAGDAIGQAQALHLRGVSASRAGQAEQAEEIFKRASGMLKRAAPPLVRPVGVVRDRLTREATIRSRAELGGRGLGPIVGGTLVGPAALRERLREIVTRDPAILGPIEKMDPNSITFRVPGRADGWGSLTLPTEAQVEQQAKPWTVGIPVGGKVTTFDLAAGRVPSSATIIEQVYEPRVTATTIAKLAWTMVDTSSTTFHLTHLYGYVLPVKIGDCYHRLGLYQLAEDHYLQAAGYTYLNKSAEGTALWIRLAANTLDWGDSLYKQERVDDAKVQYSKLITPDGAAPASMLFTTASLKVPADAARSLIENITNRPLPVVNWDIAIPVLQAFSLLQQILEGLDFYGLLLSPIHTFEYLQNVARGFATEAIHAEREFVNFKNHQELEQATRRDLETAQAMAEAEADARRELYLSAIDDRDAAQRAVDLATRRRNDAINQRNEYAGASLDQIWGQASSAALAGGEDAYWSEISELADRLDRGETISGPGPKLAAAQVLSAGRRTRQYELNKMQDNIDELTAAIALAQEQLQGAQHRVVAGEIAWQAAVQRAQMAAEAITAFDNEFFTPDAWGKMADVMRDISRSYLYRAIRIAKLMERAYNFENDTGLKIIKYDYGHGVAKAAPGRDTRLLGGDGLLQDIESFTYHAITSKIRKSSRLKDVLSVAELFPAHFEQFRETGLLAIETDLYEFDRLHPGFFGQRLEAVEVEIVGVLPNQGLNGTLTGGGVTRYRKRDGSEGKRVHRPDTMAMSDFVLRNDIFVYGTEAGVRGLFQGMGIASTWELHLPRRSNDFDFRRIFDVQLVLYYTAVYDAGLRTKVLAAPVRPGEMELLRNFGLRYDFPDAWYAFYRDGAAAFVLDRFRLPMNQQDFKVETALFRVVTKAGVDNAGIDVQVTGPNGHSGVATTDANGVISTAAAQLAGIRGADPIGDWSIEVTGGAPLTDDGQLRLDRVYNIQMGLEYSFEYVDELV